MQMSIKIDGLDNLRRQIDGISDRRMNAVVATALTRTAKATATGWQRQIATDIDKPTSRTTDAATFKGASAENLEANVYLKNKMKGTAPDTYLAPQAHGGSRLLKKFEQTLIDSGAMPAGQMTVPGQHAARDAYGNVSRSQLLAVIRSLGAQYSPGYQRVISKSTSKRLAAQAKHGRQYVAVSPQDAKRQKVSPGIYERMPDGSRKAIFLFKSSVAYRRRLKLTDRDSVTKIEREFATQFDRSLADSLSRLAAKGQP